MILQQKCITGGKSSICEIYKVIRKSNLICVILQLYELSVNNNKSKSLCETTRVKIDMCQLKSKNRFQKLSSRILVVTISKGGPRVEGH